jgi:hypothetical protein
MVQVSPRLYETGKYGMKAWLSVTGAPACLLAGDEAQTLDQIKGSLHDILMELYRRVDDLRRATVELLLPRELLCLDVDQWLVEDDFLEAIPLGVEHRLVVRSLERASRPKAALALQAREKALGRKLEEGCTIACGRDCRVLCLEADLRGGPGLLTTLRDSPSLVGVALGKAPHPSPRDPSVDVLNTLFSAGIPVVFWSRRPADDGRATSSDELLGLLGHEPFGKLPDLIWDKRKEAIRSGDDQHLGRHLTLIWDAPSRPSPDFDSSHRLRAPSRE